MKVYTITRKDIIVAITESKSDACEFFIQNNLRAPMFKIVLYTNPNICNKLLTMYQEAYIMPYKDGCLIRECDFDDINEMYIYARISLDNTISTLKSIEDFVNIKYMDDLELYKKCAKSLKKAKKDINVRDMVYEYYVNHGLYFDTFVSFGI